jgi:hypothetical protein
MPRIFSVLQKKIFSVVFLVVYPILDGKRLGHKKNLPGHRKKLYEFPKYLPKKLENLDLSVTHTRDPFNAMATAEHTASGIKY